jgi:DNA-binding transcriptional LysR family regulator
LTDGVKSVSNEPIRLPYFDWDKAKYFYYVAKLKSMNEAAKFLNIAQPALSRKITTLEDHLNCKLFTRTPKGLEISRKGEELFTIIEHTFLELKGFSYNAAVSLNINNGQKRKIRIVTTHALANHVFVDLIFNYNKMNPHIIFDLIGEDHSIDIILNDVDIAISPINESIKDSHNKNGIEIEYLCTFIKKLYASSGYLEKYGEPQSIEDLKNHHLVSFSQPEKHPYGNINWILTLGMPYGKLQVPTFTSNSIECLVEAAKRDIGIVGSYSEYKIIRNSSLQNILPDVIDKGIKDYIIYPSYLKNDKEIINFKNYLKENLP